MILPHFLSAKALRAPVQIFMCGPGFGGTSFDLREFVKRTLHGIEGVKVLYGEEVEEQKRFSRVRVDLQTLESQFAHSVDFTILLLESPGSMAELGTFSMIPNIRGRLIVLVSTQFFGSESYIARGPLSLISRSHLSHIVYYEKQNRSKLANQVLRPLVFYKFARAKYGWRYRDHVREGYRRRDYQSNDYLEYIGPIRLDFNQSIVLIGILLCDEPTFSEVVEVTGLSPDEISSALAVLIDEGRVEKAGYSRYRSALLYKDPALEFFNTNEISKERSRRIAMKENR